MNIGISISPSPDLHRRGLRELHLQDAMVGIARYLLAHGEHLAYGGDLRKGGFTELLFDLVRTYVPPGASASRAGEERVESFLPWPVHLEMDLATEESLVSYARIHRLQPPDDLDVDVKVPLPRTTPWNRYVRARSLSVMRETMNRHIAARLVLGGKLTDYKGVVPGVAEEVYLAMRERKPVFLLGGFGGCTWAIIEALKGGTPRALTTEYRRSLEGYAEMASHYKSPLAEGEMGPDFDLVDFFQRQGLAGLRNGLGEEENRRLFETVYVEEMAVLLLKGIESLESNRKPA
jgi:hypothetical protein